MIMTDRDIPQNPERQLLPTDRIEDLLPRYHEVFDDPVYIVLESMDIDGHEVAWMQYASSIEAKDDNEDDNEDGVEGGERGSQEAYLGHGLYCACDFKEGVGWEIDESKSMAISHDETEDCPYKQEALKRRHVQLFEEYVRRGIVMPERPLTSENIEDIIFDLIEKSMDHEFIELNPKDAQFWGGYFYLHTIESITGVPLDIILETADRMVKEKKITLNGYVVKSYSAAKQTRDYISVDKDDWIILAALNERELRWELTIADPDGNKIDITIQDPLEFPPPFALGPGDIGRIQGCLDEILDREIGRRAA